MEFFQNPAMTSNESFSKLGLNGNLQHAMETMGMKKPTVIQVNPLALTMH